MRRERDTPFSDGNQGGTEERKSQILVMRSQGIVFIAFGRLLVSHVEKPKVPALRA